MMTPTLRKLNLTAHITSSIGWLGALAGFLALSIAGLNSQDTHIIRASYVAMDLIARLVILPLAIVSVVTGITQSIGTSWGLVRHYWLVTKLSLTALATIVLLLKMEPIRQAAAAAATQGGFMSGDLMGLRMSLAAHAVGGLLVLLITVVLGVYKPQGLTRYGWRKQREQSALLRDGAETGPASASEHLTPLWVKVIGSVLAVLGLALAHLLLKGGHGPAMHASLGG